MAPRPAGAGKKAGKAGAEEKREDALQAVIIADTFQDRFQPFSAEKPRCLLPLANTPLIEYTLEFLAMNGVQEVFIYCGSHSEQIERYVNDSRWSPISRSCPFSVLEFIRVADAKSIGDFLRDLDSRGFIGGDFILVHGDVVSNIPLDAALAAHRQRREANRDSCMTMVLRDAGAADHATKAAGITPLFVVDPRQNRCLHYEEFNPLQSDRFATIDPEILKSPELEIRADLVDAQIDICTPDVLALWSESFDYELPRANFLHGVLKDWELNGKLIHTEIVSQGYSARADNLHMYDAITRDIQAGWVYPFNPDSNILKGQSYRLQHHDVYAEDDVLIHHSAKVTDSIIGKDTHVGHGAVVRNATVGRNCKIGSNVRIENSFIWDDAIVDDGAVIEYSLLADAVSVGKGAHIKAGALLSFGVQISPDTTINQNAAIACVSYKGEPVTTDSALVGAQGKGAIFYDPEDDEADSDDPSLLQKSLIYSLEKFDIETSSVSTLADEDDMSDDDDDGASAAASHQTPRSRLSSFASDDSGNQNFSSFHTDAVHGLLDALRGTTGDFSSEKLEFTSLRLANNASDAAMRRAVATAFVRRGIELINAESSPLEPSRAAKQVLTSKEGAAGFVSEVGVGGESVKDQVEFALAVHKACASSSRVVDPTRAGRLLTALFQQMYDLDILEEEGILGWWEDDRAKEGGEVFTTVREQCQPLVKWFEDAEEESDEDDDSADESD